MGVALKTEPMAAELLTQQQYRRRGHYEQRDQLLPIHGGKITPKTGGATRDLKKCLAFFWFGKDKICAFGTDALSPEPRGNVVQQFLIRTPVHSTEPALLFRGPSFVFHQKDGTLKPVSRLAHGQNGCLNSNPQRIVTQPTSIGEVGHVSAGFFKNQVVRAGIHRFISISGKDLDSGITDLTRGIAGNEYRRNRMIARLTR
jgi:hypothetical protein